MWKVWKVTDLVNRIKGMEEQMEQVGLLMYPIGSIYESTVNTNPQEYFGGTWEAFGAGRTTVGVDAGQTEFDQVKKTGGSKTQTLTQAQLPKITGRVEAGSGNKGTESRGYGAFRTASGVFSVNSDDYQYSMPKRENATSWPSGYGKYSFEMSVGGDQPHNNMPPYITVYRWVRIAYIGGEKWRLKKMITTAVFEPGSTTANVYGLWQYDYGQVLRIQGLHLPSMVEIHFSLQETGGTSVMRVGVTKDGVTDVIIPDSMLENDGATSDYDIFAFVYLTDATSGQTEYKIKLRVKSRPEPEVPAAEKTRISSTRRFRQSGSPQTRQRNPKNRQRAGRMAGKISRNGHRTTPSIILIRQLRTPKRPGQTARK